MHADSDSQGFFYILVEVHDCCSFDCSSQTLESSEFRQRYFRVLTDYAPPRLSWRAWLQLWQQSKNNVCVPRSSWVFGLDSHLGL